MKLLRSLLVAATIALGGLGAASTASAANLLVTDVKVDSWNQVNFAPNYGNLTSTAILFNDAFVVFCVDLQASVNVGGSQSLNYEYRVLDKDGLGNTITQVNSNRIGQLATLGRAIFNAADDGHRSQNLTAIQAAIWTIEYGAPRATSTDVYTDGKIAQYAGIAYSNTFNGGGYARGLYSLDDPRRQNMVIGEVPEPATWALMISGFGMAGVMLRRRQVAVRA
jgi:hypothetical protein